jgi:hypothetical protein
MRFRVNASMKSSDLSSKNRRTILLGGDGCQGRRFLGRSSRPLRALRTSHNGARNEAERSSVDLRSLVEGCCHRSALLPKPGEYQRLETGTGKIHPLVLSLNCGTATSAKGSVVIVRARNSVRPKCRAKISAIVPRPTTLARCGCSVPARLGASVQSDPGRESGGVLGPFGVVPTTAAGIYPIYATRRWC